MPLLELLLRFTTKMNLSERDGERCGDFAAVRMPIGMRLGRDELATAVFQIASD